MGTLCTMGTQDTKATWAPWAPWASWAPRAPRAPRTPGTPWAPWAPGASWAPWAPIGHQWAPMDTNMDTHGHQDYVSIYRSLTKKGPVPNIRPPPYLALISCKGLKFTLKRAHLVDLARWRFSLSISSYLKTSRVWYIHKINADKATFWWGLKWGNNPDLKFSKPHFFLRWS